MFVENKKYYLITYYNVYYEVMFTGVYEHQYDGTTVYRFKSSKGDLHIHEYSNSYRNNNYIVDDYQEILIELARRIAKNQDITRLPATKKKILNWAISNYPEKLI